MVREEGRKEGRKEGSFFLSDRNVSESLHNLVFTYRIFFFLHHHRCGHCKKMAPVLDKLAPVLKGKMAIAKVDCTVHKSLCKEYKVRGYPTMKYSMDGTVEDYPGGRDEDSILAFAKKMSAPSVTTVASYEEAMEFAKTQTEDGVTFLGSDPSAGEDLKTSELYRVFSKVARKKQASAYFLWLAPKDGQTNAGFVNRIEEGVKPREWDKKEMASEALSAWIQEHNVPLVATLGPNNFYKIARNGRPLAVSVVDFENDKQVEAVKTHMLDYILQTGFAESDKYYYGIIDGKKWARFLEQFRVDPEHIPQILVMDVPTKKFYQNETFNNMFEFMDAIEDGTLVEATASSPDAKGMMAKMERMFLSNFPYSLIVLLLFVFGIVFLLVPGIDDLRPKYIPDDADDGVLDEPPEDGAAADAADPDESKKDK
jgi:protein disulfide-isomerase A1